MVVKRDFYLRQLIERKHNGLVKVITGVRRVGKSYLLFNLFKAHLLEGGVKPSEIVEIALDKSEFVALTNPIRLAEYIRARVKGRKRHYVFIDEIQLAVKVRRPGVVLKDVAPEDRKSCYVTFYDVLNEFREAPNCDVYVTGSNSRMLSKDVATEFRGRGCEIRVHPFSFAEYLSVRGLEKSEVFEDYLVWGGMPMAALETNDAARARYLKDLFARVYMKDIRERNRLSDGLILDRVTDALSSSVGSLTNPHNLVNALRSAAVRTTDRTIGKYLGYLEDSFLFSSVRRFDVKGKRYLSRTEKFYAEDVGLRNARLNFRQTEVSHLMENVIYNELVRRGYSVDVGVVEVVSREKGKLVRRQHEIDFVVNLGLRKIYVQSAFAIPYAAKREQETFSLRRSGDFFRKVVVTAGSRRPLEDEDGIVFTGVIPFLLDEKVLTGGLE